MNSVSACLQEAHLMSQISSNGHFADFNGWFKKFIPQFQDEKYNLEPGNSC